MTSIYLEVNPKQKGDKPKFIVHSCFYPDLWGFGISELFSFHVELRYCCADLFLLSCVR